MSKLKLWIGTTYLKTNVKKKRGVSFHMAEIQLDAVEPLRYGSLETE